MKLTAELTFYPFNEVNRPPIKATISHIQSFEGIQAQTFPTATVVFGDYDVVMDMIKNTVAWSYREFGRSVFIVKFLPDYNAFE